MGLEQNPENYALTPKIGWKVVKNDDTPMVERMKKNTEFGLILKVKEVPEILRKMDSIPSLTLYFRDGVRFPEWMKDVKIDHLNVFGEITKEEQKKLLERCPSSTIRVNNVIYDRRGKKINVHCIDNEIGSALDGVDSIGTLKIDNSKRVYYNRIAEYKPDEWVKVTNVKLPADVTKNIDTLILENKLPRMQMKQLKKQLPNTVILYHYEVSFGEQYMAQGPQSTFSLLKNKYSRQKPKDISVDTEKLMENLPPRQPMPQLQEEKR